MKKNFLITVLISILLVGTAFAELTADAENIENSIYLDERARYDISLTNSDAVNKVFQVYVADVRWHVELSPSYSRIDPNTTLNFELNLVPSVWAQPGIQTVNVFIESPAHDDKISLQIPVYVKSFDVEPKQYTPSIELMVTFPEEVDPRETIPLSVYLRNRNRLDIEQLDLTIESEYFTEYRTIELGPLSEKREKFLFEIDSLTEPSDEVLEVRISIENKTINNERVSFKVIPYSEFVRRKDTVEELFKRTTEYVVVNEGNIRKRDIFHTETNFVRRIFTRANPSPTRINLQVGEYEWILDLGPDEEATIIVTENYRPLIYLVLIGIFITILYFLYRSPVMIRKEAIVMGSSDEGISEMKILIHVRNRSQDLIENLKVTDLVPSLATLVKEKSLGSLSPSKIIKHQKRGTIVKWNLEALEPFEERIITYRVKSKIAIVGGVTLPSAKVKFETTKGKERTVLSSRTQVSMGL